jgi:beta-galactosidase
METVLKSAQSLIKQSNIVVHRLKLIFRSRIILKQFFFLIAIILFVLVTREAIFAGDSAREKLCMDSEWRFALGHATDPNKDFDYSTAYFTHFAKAGYGDGAASAYFDDRAWRVLDLPHDWCVELPFNSKGSHSHGYKEIGYNFPENSIGWYRKTFFIPESDFGKRISIRFDGVHRNSRVWVNGFYLGEENSGYTSFSYNITEYLNYGGNNIIAVRVDASMEEGWFYEGAGIYRHVWLIKTNPLHIAEYGTFITTEIVNGQAIIKIRTTIENEFDKKAEFEIEETIIDPDEKIISKNKTENLSLISGDQKEFITKHEVIDPKIWSLEKPYLHKLQSKILKKNKVIDQYETIFGIRTIRFDPNSGFFLNGKYVKIKGTNNHQDHAGVGTAIPDALQEFRINRLKEMGSNAIRTSHNPPTPELLDVCDRLGMLVLDENRLMGTNKEHLYCLERLIKRDRNHPSVVIWSLGNEEWAIEGNEKGVRITKTMQTFANRLDSSRAFTVACSGGWDNGIGTVSQVMGYNYIFHGDIDAHHIKFPWQPAVGTEESTMSGTRGIYVTDAKNAHQALNSFISETSSIEKSWKFYYERPFLTGLFYWTGFDYRGEPNPYGWPQVTSQFGILDLCGFPKDHFYYLKAWWGNDPVLYISPHWNWNGEDGQEIEVTINTNLDEVELYLNKRSIGKKEILENSSQNWQVIYEPGILEAVGYKNGIEVLHKQRKTTGKPSAIQLLADRSQIKADGKDVSVITVRVIDEILFSLKGIGKIIGVGNGNPSSHEPDKFLPTIKVSKISNLKELRVNGLEDRKEVSEDYNDSGWISAFSNEPQDWREYRDSLIVIRGTFELPEIKSNDTVNLFTKSIVENQSIYINGELIKTNIKRDDPNQFFQLDHNIIKKGKNNYAVTGKRFRLRHRWDEPNRDPGLLQIIRPAEQWKRRVFNGLAQIIIQSGMKSEKLILKASSPGLQLSEIKIETIL